eukprot:m.368971 g.368971  ORF g.368971 m.368971 type:complete len:83 (+) comp47093_c0_seq1:73-321(+)
MIVWRKDTRSKDTRCKDTEVQGTDNLTKDSALAKLQNRVTTCKRDANESQVHVGTRQEAEGTQCDARKQSQQVKTSERTIVN